MGRYVRGNIDLRFALGTLGSATAILAALSAVNERTLVTSIVAQWTVSEFTVAVGDGPIAVGVAHSDYSLVEIEEYLEQTDSWDEGNKVAQEVGKRQIRRIGTISPKDISLGSTTINDGKAIKTKLNWILNQGQTVNVWAYNGGGSALATADPDVIVWGYANLFPK